MKIESLLLKKFEQNVLKSNQLKEVIGGEQKCTGGGFNIYGAQADAGGMQYIYETWDSDTTDSDPTRPGTTYNYKDNVLGDCFQDDIVRNTP